MRKFKKELSWLLVTALVVSSLVVGFAQLKTEAAPIYGTGFFKLEIPIDSNSGSTSPGNSRGTDSSFRLQLINAGSGIVGSTSDNVISGTNTGYGDPLENGQTTTYSSFGAGGNVAVIHSEMGAIKVDNTIKQMQLVCTNQRDDWWFADVRLYYSTTGNNANWVQLTSGGWQASGGTGTWNISNDWFVNNNRTLTFNSNGGSAGNIVYDAIPGQTISSPSSAGTRTGYTYAGWSGVPARMPNANSTYYAQWNPITYTVAYNGNGHTGGSTASSSHTYDAAKNLTNNGFTKTGYNFAGWNTAAGGTGTSYSNGQSVTNLANTQGATVTLYAQWTPITYTVAYNGNGNTGGSTASSSHTYNSAKNLTANGFTRTGYTFAGWNTAANGSGTSYTNGQSVTNLTTTQGATVTLYAQWNVNYYNLTYDANGGTGGSGPTSTAYGTALNPPTVTRTGHTFNGWSPPVPSTMPAANSTYTAQWSANTYNVVFNGNGNTGGTMSAQGITYGSTANLTANAFTKTGYNFAGWNTASDGSGTAYANQASYGPMGASDVTLYAQWSIGSYNLTFDANGGTGGTGPTPTQYGASISAPTVTRTGYTFNGWVPAVPPTMPGADSTYVAQWTVNQYTVSFDSNGGSAVNAITQNYGTQVAKPTDPTKTGHTFDGWYSDSGLTTAVTWPYTMGASDVTFYAKWTVNNYNITFDANGGTGGTGPTSMAYGSALSAPTVTRTGYTFSHWSPTVPATVPAQDTTYTAQWTANQYTISFNSNGGSAVGSITQAYGTDVSKPADPTKLDYAFDGWYSDAGLTTAVTWPYTMGAANVTFYAKWSVTEMSVAMSGDDFIVYINGWTNTSEYQIWTYQQVTSDDVLSGDTNVKKDQWILSMPYASAADGNPEPDGSISFNIDGFISSTENYIVAVRIADANGNFVKEIRDAYTPAGVGEAVITKVMVDGAVTTGYELKEIKTGASVDIEVVGNDVANLVYSAEVVNGVSPTALTGNGNEFNWDISALQPGIYLIELSATNGSTTDKKLVEFELYAAAPAVNFGVLNSMAVAYSNGNVSVTPNFTNGTFCYYLHEPGRRSAYSLGGFTTNDPIDYAYEAPGIYQLAGFVTRGGAGVGAPVGTENAYYDEEVSYDDGMVKTLIIPRTGGGTVSVTLSGPQGSVAKGTALQITAQSQGITGTAKYSFWRYDANGTVLVQDWSTAATLNWTPGRVGSYNIEVRVKGDDAGSYEAKANVLVEVTSATEAKANVTSFTVNSGYVSANAVAKKPILIQANATASGGEDLLYRFYVYDPDMRERTLKEYSVNPTCVWTPRKAGLTYTIYVLVKSEDSFGKFDAIQSFNVTV